MYDSRPDERSPYGYAWSDDVTQEVKQDGSKITLTLTADEKWLKIPPENSQSRLIPPLLFNLLPEMGQEQAKTP